MTKVNPSMQITLLAKGFTAGKVAFMENVPSLITIRQAYGHKWVKEWIFQQTMAFLDYAEQKAGVAEEKIMDMAEIISCQYYHLNAYDIVLFFGRLRMGMYGSFYGTVGPMQLMDKFRLYLKDRDAEIESMQNEENVRRAEELRREPNLFQIYLTHLKAAAEEGNVEAKEIWETRYKKYYIADG